MDTATGPTPRSIAASAGRANEANALDLELSTSGRENGSRVAFKRFWAPIAGMFFAWEA
jgi:hypothetical protein